MPLDKTAKCTVCIPTYNQSKHLRRAIQSVIEQTAPVLLIVSNDASTDDTAEVMAELQAQHPFAAVSHMQNRGISAHLEWLLRQPETPLIMRLDSDDFLHPEYIGVLQDLMERHPKAGYGHCAVMEVDADDRPLGERRVARTQDFEDGERLLRRSVMGYQVAANVVMFRRDALVSVDYGAASEKLNFVEDYDLSIRLADAGWGNVYSNRILAYYRVWGDSSRPVTRRKLAELRGLTQIFTGSLYAAFARRRWKMDILRRRRMELALNNSDVLDRSIFAPGEREEIVEALVELGGTKTVRLYMGTGILPRSIRRSVAVKAEIELRLKRWVKRVLLGRR